MVTDCRLAGTMCMWIQVHGLQSEAVFLDASVIWVWVCVFAFSRVMTVLTGTCNVSPKPIALFSKHLPHFATKTHSSSTQLREALRENNNPSCIWLPHWLCDVTTLKIKTRYRTLWTMTATNHSHVTQPKWTFRNNTLYLWYRVIIC